MKKTLAELSLNVEKGSIRELILSDADGEVSYIKDVADHGCSGGNCGGLIYYVDTHKFTTEHMDEINDIVSDYYDNTGVSLPPISEMHGDMFNWLAWFAYEVRAQEIMKELEPEL